MKNRTRVVILTALILINVLFLFFADKGSGVSFDEDLFVIADTAGISSVTIRAAEQDAIHLNESPQGWQLNEEYQADEGLIRVLLSIVHRVQVKKPVDLDPAKDAVEVGIAGADPMSFYVWGNPTKTRTFFSLTGSSDVYEVVIPGYNEYVGGIFELNQDQWRDRLVMNESWRTIQDLTLDYHRSEENDFSIEFDDNFYRMEKVEQLDSTTVVDYLNQFQYFQTNEWISKGRFPRYDSLSKTPPLATLKIESINSEFPKILDIYPKLEGEQFHLLMNAAGEMMAVSQHRVNEILKQPDDFRFRKPTDI